MKQRVLIFLVLVCAITLGGGYFWLNSSAPLPANKNITRPENKENLKAGAESGLVADKKEGATSNASGVTNTPEPENGNPPALTVTPEQYFYMTPAGQAFREAGDSFKRKMKADELAKEDLEQCLSNLISEPLERQVPFIAMSDAPDLRDYLRFLLKDLRVARLLTVAQTGSDEERAELLILVREKLTAILSDNENTALFFSHSHGKYGGAVALPLILAKLAPTPEHLGMLAQLYERSLETENSIPNMGIDPEFDPYNATRMLLVHASTQMLPVVAEAVEKDASQFSQAELSAIESFKNFVEARVNMARQFVELNRKHNVLGEELNIDSQDEDALFQLYMEATEGIQMIVNNQSDYHNAAGRDRQELMAIAREFK